MKKIIIYSTLIAFLVSCGAATDKKAELEIGRASCRERV